MHSFCCTLCIGQRFKKSPKKKRKGDFSLLNMFTAYDLYIFINPRLQSFSCSAAGHKKMLSSCFMWQREQMEESTAKDLLL